MALTKPTGKLVIKDPAKRGVLTQYGYARDWYPNDKWARQGVDWIEPLNALAPLGDLRPIDMTSAAWTVHASYSQAVRTVTVSGNPPAAFAEFYDCTPYQVPQAATDVVALLYTGQTEVDWWQPAYVAQLVRYTPPPGQELQPQVSIVVQASLKVTNLSGIEFLDPVDGTWVDGSLSLILPYNTPAARRPLLFAKTDDQEGSPYIDGFVLSEGPEVAAITNGVVREGWVFEYVEDQDHFPGGHILVRSTVDGGRWWHTYHDCVRCVPGPLQVAITGARQAVNVSPIYYSNSAADDLLTWPVDYKPLPTVYHEAAASWSALSTAATNWVVAVSGDDWVNTGPIAMRPVVEFQPAEAESLVRPVVWCVGETHDPTLTVPTGLPADVDTDSDGLLRSLSISMDNTWRGTRATCDFYPYAPLTQEQVGVDENEDPIYQDRYIAEAPYPDLKERSEVDVHFGWQAGADTGYPAANQATLYIMPGGIERWRSGDEYAGAPQLRLQLGDFIAARMEQTCVVDMRQAAGQTVGDWFTSCAKRLGLPDSLIDVDASVADTVIVTSEIPSRPTLVAQDGQAWEQHLDDVCAAMNLRWGWDHTAGLFVDAGRPQYEHGTSGIQYSLDHDALTDVGAIYAVRREHDGRRYRNCWKASHGRYGNTQETYHLATADEIETTGLDLWAYFDATDVYETATFAKRFAEDFETYGDVIVWEMAAYPALKPDHFVSIGDVPEIGCTDGAVYQVTQHTLQFDAATMTGVSNVTAVKVWEPEPEA